MGFLNWILNPIGSLINTLAPPQGQDPPSEDQQTDQDPWYERFGNWVNGLWNDYTGKSQIEMQNEYQRQLAEEEYQRNLQSIGDTATAYEGAGFNRNMVYGSGNGSPVSYQAPNLQAYSGSAKLDTILNRVGKALSIIPAVYQATAALESIDQAREKTKQSEIRTTAMGLDLLDKGYRLGDKSLSRPFIARFLRPGRNWEDQTDFVRFSGVEGGDLRSYQDAAIKNQMDLLRSIGIKNQLNSTRNSYLGYQYDLDRRFGAAGRIVGMASQGLGSVSNLFGGISKLRLTNDQLKLHRKYY